MRLATAALYQSRNRDREADALAAEVARLRSVNDGARQAWADIGLRCDVAEAEVARLREALEASEARAVKAAEACEALETLVDDSSRMFHDATRWESEDETGPLWQAWRNWAYDAIKAAKGAGR